MKPMTTISFPTGEYVLVPVEPTLEMVCAAENFIGRHAYKKAIEAIPDQLPGVVVHSGGAVAWADALKITDLREVDDALRNFSNDPTEDNAVCVVLKVLQAHPTPSQPSAEALVQAALEAAVKELMTAAPWLPSLSEAADVIRALDKQQIIESCKGEKS